MRASTAAAGFGAERLSAALARGGLDEATLFIVAGVSEGAEPVVHVTMTAAGLTGWHLGCHEIGSGPPSWDRYERFWGGVTPSAPNRWISGQPSEQHKGVQTPVSATEPKSSHMQG